MKDVNETLFYYHHINSITASCCSSEHSPKKYLHFPLFFSQIFQATISGPVAIALLMKTSGTGPETTGHLIILTGLLTLVPLPTSPASPTSMNSVCLCSVNSTTAGHMTTASINSISSVNTNCFNTLRLEQNGSHIADDNHVQMHLLERKFWFKFHWSLLLVVQLTSQYWIR